MSHHRFGIDTSCLVPLVSSWHGQHRTTVSAVLNRTRAGGKIVLAAHSLLEAYSVLTRLPSELRISPAEAEAALTFWAEQDALLVSITPEQTRRALRLCTARGTAGGQAYDAAILVTLEAAGVSEILTWNVKHFAPLAPPSIAITRPA